MPTQHYAVSGSPSEALAALRAAAPDLGWQVDIAASSSTLLTLKRDADAATWGWSAAVSVQGYEDDTTTLVATSDDAAHLSSELREGHDLHALLHAIGARRA